MVDGEIEPEKLAVAGDIGQRFAAQAALQRTLNGRFDTGLNRIVAAGEDLRPGQAGVAPQQHLGLDARLIDRNVLKGECQPAQSFGEGHSGHPELSTD